MSVVVAIVVVLILLMIASNVVVERQKVTYTPDVNLENIHGMAFSSAGILGYSFVGALETLTNHGLDLSKVTHFAGCSAGSIVATMLSIRVPLPEIKKHFFEINALNIFDQKYKNDFTGIFKRFAMYSSHCIEDMMVKLLDTYTGIKGITFAQVKEKYGTTLIIPGTGVSKQLKTVYMSYETHPETPIARAVRASSSIPFMFSPVNIGSDRIVDGAVTDAYIAKEMLNYLPIDELLFMSIDHFQLASDNLGMFNRFLRQASGGLYLLWRTHNGLSKEEKQHMIYITCTDCPMSVNFFIDDDDRQKIYESGIKSTERYLAGHEYSL